MNVILLGYPGSGKGTQARVLSRKLGLLHVSTGDIFREELAKKTALGQEVADYFSAGQLAPDWLVLDMLKHRLSSETRGLLFDGFPCTVEQAEGLDEWFTSRSMTLDAVIFLNLPEAEVARRLGDRRICVKCGTIYNLHIATPTLENACDSCGGALTIRGDDKPEVIKKRIMVYKDQTEPLVSYYKGNSFFSEVKADQPPQVITEKILSLLKAG
jgi:adenylate kinase